MLWAARLSRLVAKFELESDRNGSEHEQQGFEEFTSMQRRIHKRWNHRVREVDLYDTDLMNWFYGVNLPKVWWSCVCDPTIPHEI